MQEDLSVHVKEPDKMAMNVNLKNIKAKYVFLSFSTFSTVEVSSFIVAACTFSRNLWDTPFQADASVKRGVLFFDDDACE